MGTQGLAWSGPGGPFYCPAGQGSSHMVLLHRVVAFIASSLHNVKDVEPLLLAGLRRAQAPALSGVVHSLPLAGHRTTKLGCDSLDHIVENQREDESKIQQSRRSCTINHSCDPGATDRTSTPREAQGQVTMSQHHNDTAQKPLTLLAMQSCPKPLLLQALVCTRALSLSSASRPKWDIPRASATARTNLRQEFAARLLQEEFQDKQPFISISYLLVPDLLGEQG